MCDKGTGVLLLRNAGSHALKLIKQDLHTKNIQSLLIPKKHSTSLKKTMSNSVNDPYLRHLFDGDLMFNVYNPDIYNLSVGAPGPDLLQHCTSLMAKATTHRLNQEQKEGKYFLFQYGITAGLWECRDELAKFLTRRYGDPVFRENLILSCGATHGLQLLLNSIISPNGVIFVDEVTYMIALEAFKHFPLIKIVPVPMADNVVNLDALEEAAKREFQSGNYLLENDKIFWAAYYAIPTFHNPTGMAISSDQSKALVQLARKYSFVVMCDDVYNLLYYNSGYPPHRLLYYDDPKDPQYMGGNVVSNGSFSKILSPAIRLGWIEAGPRIVNNLKQSGILKSGGAVNHYVSGLIASALELNLEDEYLDRLIETFKQRMETLCQILDEQLPSTCSYQRPEGGYFVWIKLPEDMDASLLISFCQKVYKVSAIPGSRFSYHGESKNFLRVSIAFHKTSTIELAASALCKAIEEFQKSKNVESHKL